MQTLQTARLASQAIGIPVRENKTPRPPDRPGLLRPSGILRHRADVVGDVPPVPFENPQLAELLARFFATNGLPYDTIQDPSFRALIQNIQPNLPLPSEDYLTSTAVKLAGYAHRTLHFSRSVGPLSLTLDICEDEDQKYIVFSVHHFEDLFERKNSVYLRKLLLSELDAECILNIARRVVNKFSYSQIRFSNLMCPNQKIYNLLHKNSVGKRYFICFFDYITRFVKDLLEIPEIKEAMQIFRNFVTEIRKDPEMYSKFRRIQLTKGGPLDLPTIDDNDWGTAYNFLTFCLSMYDKFGDFLSWIPLTDYITTEQFNLLVAVQKILKECVDHCQELSVPENSMSQVVPAVTALKNFISQNAIGMAIGGSVRDSFFKTFQDLVQSVHSERYDLAALLDPRFGYKDEIYPPMTWRGLEDKLVDEFQSMDGLNRRYYFQEIANYTNSEREFLIRAEISCYRRLCSNNPKIENFWSTHSASLEHLAVLAREYVACPAVSIDVNQYFGKHGKFSHICKIYDSELVDNSLVLAGNQLRFRGRGGSFERIPNSVIHLMNTNAFKYRDSGDNQSLDFFKKRNPPKAIKSSLRPPGQIGWKPKVIMIRSAPVRPVPILRHPPIGIRDFKIQRNPKIMVNPIPAEPEIKVEPIEPDFQKLEKEIKQEIVEEEIEDVGQPGLTKEVKQEMEVPIPPPVVRGHPIVLMPKRKPSSNRRCFVCHHLEPSGSVKNVTVDSEKIILIVGCIYRGEMTLEAALEDPKIVDRCHSKMYFCHVHFVETLDDVYRMLQVTHYSEIRNCQSEGIQKMLETVQSLRPEFSETRFRMMLHTFCERTTKLYPVVKDLDENHRAINGITIPIDDETEIAPKHSRPPRKQILEIDDEAVTVKMIKKRVFQFPESEEDPNNQIDEMEDPKNSGLCCYCKSIRARGEMLKVPRSENHLSRWFDKLGPEFEARIVRDAENLICRRHFPENSFSSRGRLLRGMIPYEPPETAEVTYRINGNGDFLKLAEQKTRTGKSATIDLETRRRRWISQMFEDVKLEDVEDSEGPSLPKVPKMEEEWAEN